MSRSPSSRFFMHAAMVIMASTLYAGPQRAVARDVSFFSTGAGKLRCDTYLQSSQGIEPNAFKYHQKGQRTYVSENAIYDHWIYGFVSALNFASAADGDKKPDVQVRNVELIGWIRDWCAGHADASVLDGALSFMKERWARGAN